MFATIYSRRYVIQWAKNYYPYDKPTQSLLMQFESPVYKKITSLLSKFPTTARDDADDVPESYTAVRVELLNPHRLYCLSISDGILCGYVLRDEFWSCFTNYMIMQFRLAQVDGRKARGGDNGAVGRFIDKYDLQGYIEQDSLLRRWNSIKADLRAKGKLEEEY